MFQSVKLRPYSIIFHKVEGTNTPACFGRSVDDEERELYKSDDTCPSRALKMDSEASVKAA
jgi:hypothetical protein